MKKIAAFFLSAALLFSFAGCSETAPEEISKPDWWVEPTPTPDLSSVEPVKIGETFTIAGEYDGGRTIMKATEQQDAKREELKGRFFKYCHLRIKKNPL